MSRPLLSCRGLTVRFGGLLALDGLDIDVGEGETLGLVGPNGSGKTTFFNVATGLYRPAAGSFAFGGADLFGASPQDIGRAGIARTFQRARLMLDQSVFDNLALGMMRRLGPGVAGALAPGRARRRQLGEAVERARSLTRRFNPLIADGLSRAAGSFSMIDRRRIEVCRALLASPRLLLLDEPSAGMTHDETRRLMDDLLSFRDGAPDLAVVLIEHEMGVIGRVADRCACLNFGRKVFDGGFADLVADPGVQSAYLGPTR